MRDYTSSIFVVCKHLQESFVGKWQKSRACKSGSQSLFLAQAQEIWPMKWCHWGTAISIPSFAFLQVDFLVTQACACIGKDDTCQLRLLSLICLFLQYLLLQGKRERERTLFFVVVVVVQSLSRVQLFVIPQIAACQASLSSSIFQSLLKLMPIVSMIPSNYLILCHPLLFSSSIFPSIRVFSSKSALRNRWRNYWSFSFSINPSNEQQGLTSFRIDLCAVQGTLKSLLQHHNSKASSLHSSAFFMVQFSHVYMTTGNTKL